MSGWVAARRGGGLRRRQGVEASAIPTAACVRWGVSEWVGARMGAWVVGEREGEGVCESEGSPSDLIYIRCIHIFVCRFNV